MERRDHRITFAAKPGEVLAVLPEAVEAWNGTFTPQSSGGRLEIPVRYGLRYGSLMANVHLDTSGAETSVTLEETGEELRLHTSAVAVLLFAALAAMAIVLWPLFPALLSLVPLALVLGVAAWLLVVSRLQSAGPQEFLQWLRECTEKKRSVR